MEQKRTATELNENEVAVEELLGHLDEAEATEPEEVVDFTGVTLPLINDPIKKDGKIYHNFYVPVTVYGKPAKIEMRPKDGDRLAYIFLEGIFGDARQGELRCSVKTMKEEGAKKKRSYMVYTVEGVDESSGLPVVVALTPYGDSSKRMLEALYNQKQKALI